LAPSPNGWGSSTEDLISSAKVPLLRKGVWEEEGEVWGKILQSGVKTKNGEVILLRLREGEEEKNGNERFHDTGNLELGKGVKKRNQKLEGHKGERKKPRPRENSTGM